RAAGAYSQLCRPLARREPGVDAEREAQMAERPEVREEAVQKAREQGNLLREEDAACSGALLPPRQLEQIPDVLERHPVAHRLSSLQTQELRDSDPGTPELAVRVDDESRARMSVVGERLEERDQAVR